MRRLSVDADLDLTIDGHAVAVRGDGDRVTVSVEDARTAWRLFQTNRPGRHLVRTVTDTLDALGVDVDVVVGGHSLLSFGPSAARGALSRALGIPARRMPAPLRDGRVVWVALGIAVAAGVFFGVRR